jgi:tetratricopeptide (TPR) repeat protein
MKLEIYAYSIIFILGLALGYFIFSKINRKTCMKNAGNLYDFGKRMYDDQEYFLALESLHQSIGFYKYYETYNLIGHIYDEMGQHNLAAHAFDEARWLSWRFNLEYVTYSFYRSSFSYAKANNWEFSYTRANEGLQSIIKGVIPKASDGLDCEEKLRSCRMVSSLHHLNGTNAFDSAIGDAAWLLSNSKDKINISIAKGILGVKFISDDFLEELTSKLI